MSWILKIPIKGGIAKILFVITTPTIKICLIILLPSMVPRVKIKTRHLNQVFKKIFCYKKI